MTKPSLLIIEDDEDIRTQMRWALADEYAVVTAGDCASAVAAFAEHEPVVTILDLGLPPRPGEPTEGLATLAALLTHSPRARIVVATGQGEKRNALEAIGGGASDFFSKPVDLDLLRIVLHRHAYVAALEEEQRASRDSEVPQVFEGMLGASPAMATVFTLVAKAAPTTAPVLILGGSGTGKEMVAQALHRRSQSRNGPFIALNCSAIPEALLESELFGHERGAFTGAHAMRKGLVESAAGGTLFLDEIGELPAALQVKLLRFLQEKKFQRVGGRHEIVSDARVVSATNANLQEAVACGTFREDLYFRLAVVVIKVPSLRDRADDVTLIAGEFLKRSGQEHGRPRLAFAPDALAALSRHAWPGNVRELQNRVSRAVIMADGRRVTAADLELVEALDVEAPTLRSVREHAEREVIVEALRRHKGRIASAATELGVSRPTLYELMAKLGVDRA